MKISVGKVSGKAYLSGAMTDISFLLIIFFLVAAVFISDQGLLVLLPDKEDLPIEIEADQILFLEINDVGAYYIDGNLVSADKLQETIHSELNSRNDPVIIIEVAPGIKYQETLSAMQTAKKAGGNNFSISVQNSNPVPVDLGSIVD